MNMPHTYIADLKDHVDQIVTLAGWCYNKRSSGKLRFILVRDGTGICQSVAFKKDLEPDVFARCDELEQETAIRISGKVRAEPRAPGGYELSVTDLEIVGVSHEYPITPKEHGIAYLMEHRHLWLRSKRQHAILRVRHHICRAIRDFLDDSGFIQVDAPILTGNACEGTTTLFETDYFGEKAYLSQSGQLYNEATAMAFGRVYCFGPTFRSEKSKTRRHLTEFWMVEPEIAFIDLEGVMDLTEAFLEYVVQTVLTKCRPELETLERDLSKLEAIRRPFPRLSYDEATALLTEIKAEWAASEDEEKRKTAQDILKQGVGADLGAADETALGSRYEKPILVHRYPAEVKAFYMKADDRNPGKALCVDVLAPEGYGEIIGGGQREDDLNRLLAKIEEHQLPREAFSWFLDLRTFGSVPHGGFGLGIERTVAWLCGLHHVRETIPFPRLMDKIWP